MESSGCVDKNRTPVRVSPLAPCPRLPHRAKHPRVCQPTCPFLSQIPTPTRENTVASFLSLLRAQQTVGARVKGRVGDAACLVVVFECAHGLPNVGSWGFDGATWAEDVFPALEAETRALCRHCSPFYSESRYSDHRTLISRVEPAPASVTSRSTRLPLFSFYFSPRYMVQFSSAAG